MELIRANSFARQHHAQTTLLVLPNLDFNPLVRLSGISCRLEGVSRHSQNDSRLGVGEKGLRQFSSDWKRSDMPSTPGICVVLASSMLCPVLQGSNRESEVPYSQSSEVSKAGSGRPQQININRATVAELKTLPGVGEATARRIVAYRSKNPPFRRIEELLIIRGISRNRLEQIRHRIRLD